MKKKLTNTLLIIISAFTFAACGDSKESVAKDLISLMEESAEAIKSEDKDAIAKIEEKGKALEERMKAVGIEAKDLSTLPEELQEKYKEAAAKLLKASMEKAMNNAPKIPSSAKIKAKELLDSAPEIPESAKELMKDKIDSLSK